MSLLTRIRSRARENRGGVLVFVGLFAPVAVLFCAFVIDLGNGWWHQRHLQVQADAAALAAAQDLFPCSDATVSADAQSYGGVAGTAIYNQQVGGTSSNNIHQVINSRTFWGQSSPVDSSVSTASPCNAGMVDVKMTEANLPFFLPVFSGAFNGLPYINAHARVELRNETVSAKDAPIAVNDVQFAYAEAYFINENTGAPIGAVALSDTGTTNGLDVWASAPPANCTANPPAIPCLKVPNDPAATGTTLPDSDVGVRIALAGATPPNPQNMAATCATAGTLCFDRSSANAQLADIHGYNPTGTGSPTAPVNHGVLLTPLSACDQYYTASVANCTDALQATLDLGNSLNGVTVSAVVAGGTPIQLTCPNPTGNPKLTTCTSPAGGIPVTAGSGRNRVDLQVVYTQGAGKNKTTTTTTIANAQSTYAGSGASTTSGPIQALSLSVNGTSDMSALQEGSVYPVTVTVGITPSLSVAQPTDQPVTMRFDGVGSQNQSVNCTPVSTPQNFDSWGASLATGCQGPYAINPTLSCPDNNTPVDCVPVSTGNQTNKVAKALNYRILCVPTPSNCTGTGSPAACTAPNHWPTYKASDPRIVTVFITPYDSFSGSGSSTSYPIQAFAAFYVTGWASQGQGNTNPCQPSSPPGGAPLDDYAAPGTMVGHFIHYVQFLNDGSGGTQSCVPNSLNECIAVMTR